MLTEHRKPVSLTLMAFDLPLWSVLETSATLYQKDQEQFHLLLTEPVIQSWATEPSTHTNQDVVTLPTIQTPRLLWLEISPYRVIMTMQGNGKFSYRHFWEQGVYGSSRYWLQNESLARGDQMRLRNFTRRLSLNQTPLPQHLRVEYELWANQLRMGHYVMNVEIHH